MRAVTQRREGPTSSATISTLDRLSPSWVSHERFSRRPVTQMRSPLEMDSETLSARSRQQTTTQKEVSSCPSLFCMYRRFTAPPRRERAVPLVRSGSYGLGVTFQRVGVGFSFGIYWD